jgi:hypothetical protein
MPSKIPIFRPGRVNAFTAGLAKTTTSQAFRFSPAAASKRAATRSAVCVAIMSRDTGTLRFMSSQARRPIASTV